VTRIQNIVSTFLVNVLLNKIKLKSIRHFEWGFLISCWVSEHCPPKPNKTDSIRMTVKKVIFENTVEFIHVLLISD